MSIIDTDALLKALGPSVRAAMRSVVRPLPLAPDPARGGAQYLQLRDARGCEPLGALDRGLHRRQGAGQGASWHRQPDARRRRDRGAAAARSVDVGGYLLDFSANDRPGSHYVDFAMFGAQGRILQ